MYDSETERGQADSRETEVRDHDNDRTGLDDVSRNNEKLHTHILRSNCGGLDTGREKEAAKLRDESGAQPSMRARSIPGSSPAKSRGSSRDRLFAISRVGVENWRDIRISVSLALIL